MKDPENILFRLILTFVSLALLGPSLHGQRQNAETLTVTIGSTELIDLPFAGESFLIAQPDVASAIQLGEGRKIQISGLRAGSTDLTVVGNGQTRVYKINVIEDVKAIYASLLRDLDTVPEVQLETNGPRVVVRGEVHDIDNWNVLQRVLEVYGDDVLSLATFRPAPEVARQLHESLRKAGFTVLEPEQEVEPGQVRLRFSGNSLFIKGVFLMNSDIDRLRRGIGTHRWIEMDRPENRDNQGTGRVRAVLDVEVIPTMLDVEIAFVGVSDTEQDVWGVNLFEAGLLTISTTSLAFQGEIDGPSGWADDASYSIGTDIGGTLNFTTTGGPGRFIRRGHLSFRNDEEGWKSFQDGGTIKVRVASDNAVGLEDIPYGLILKVRGGLANLDSVNLDLDVELSSPLLQRNGDYNLVSQNVETSVQIPLGHTMVVSGVDSLAEAIENSGVPILRDIPVIKYLFSEERRTKEDRNVLILVSPRLAIAPRKADSSSLAESNLEAEARARLPLDYKPEPEADGVSVEIID